MIFQAVVALLPMSFCGAVTFEKPATAEQLARYSNAQASLVDFKTAREKANEQKRELERLQRALNKNQTKIELAQAALLEQQQKLLISGNRTIEAVIDAYGIAPDRLSAPIVVKGSMEGKTATWSPFFGFLDPRTIQDKNGFSKDIAVPEDWKREGLDGVTYPDGAIEMTEHAFSSLAMLAAYIIHETVHFDQKTTEGRGDNLTSYREEFEAYGATLNSKTILTLGLTASEVKAIERGRINGLRRAESEDGKRFFRPGLADARDIPESAPERPEPVKDQGSSEFLEAWRGSARGVASVKERIATMEQERAAQEEARRKEEEESARTIKRWTAACGFEHDGTFQLDLSSPEPNRGSASLRAQTPDQLRAALIVAGACNQPEYEEPCIDGQQALDRNWPDPEFRDSLLLAHGSSEFMVNCVWSVVERYKRGGGFKKVRKIALEFEEEEYRQRQEAIRERERQHEQPSQSRERRSSPTDPDREWDPILQRYIRRIRP